MVVEISLVVPTFQRERILRESLPTLLAQDLEPGRWEVVVVVDGSTDGTEGYLASMDDDPRLRTVIQENRGLSAARNRGAREASGAVVLFLDDDAHALTSLARAHLARHGGEENRVVMGPFRLLRRTGASFLATGVDRWAKDSAARLSAPGYRTRFSDVSFANTSMPRSLWEGAGGFDESFRRFGNEDYEFGRRLLEAGVEFVFAPEAEAFQDYRKGFSLWCAEWRDIGRADVGLWRKHRDVETDLAFSGLDRVHPLRRASCRAGMRDSFPVRACLAPVRFALALAHQFRLRGWVLDHLKWLPADYEYGRGLRDAVLTAPADAVPPSLRPYFR